MRRQTQSSSQSSEYPTLDTIGGEDSPPSISQYNRTLNSMRLNDLLAGGGEHA